MKEMLTEAEVRDRILAQIEPLPAEPLPLLRARDRFAAQALWAEHPLPGFDNSSMDGYAVAWDAAEDDVAPLPAGTRLRVRDEQPAGADRSLRAAPGEAIRIFTGAPLPAGSRAVVMQEDVWREGDEIVLQEPVQAGENIRRAGADLARGQKLFDAGDRLTPQRLALLASQGISEIAVSRAPRVAILTTGDELRLPGQPLEPGEIYESNGTALAALAASLGAEVTLLGSAVDERSALDAQIRSALFEYDALVVAGGVSVGERDLVKDSLAAAGAELDLWRVRVKPGKPFVYGRGPAGDGPEAKRTHVFGLPGNPVSAFVTFLLFARPALLKLMGASEDSLAMPQFPATARAELVNLGDRPHYQHGCLDDEGRFVPVGRQESHALFGLSRSHALTCVEPGARIPVGAIVKVLLWEI